MKSVLISIRPKWVEKIANGEKTIEVRKTAPKCKEPFKCYIYCTKDKYEWLYRVDNNGYGKPQSWHGKVIGEFICDWIKKITPHCDIDGFVNQYIHGYPAILGDNDCLSFNDMKAYLGNKKGYDWHISDLKIYDKPKELREFCIPCKTNCEDCKEPLFYDCWREKGRVKVVTRPPQSWCYVEALEEMKK